MTNCPRRSTALTPRRRHSSRAFAPVLAAAIAWSTAANAAPPGQSFETVHVLELVQKGELTTVRALTAALKQRVRDSSEHALGNTDLPFEALMAQCSRQALLGTDGALHEPPRRCLDVVGSSLSGSATVPAAYLWGALYRSPGARAELRVRLHLWREGVNDRVEQAVVPEVADGEALDALAERLVGRLLYPGRVSLVRVTAGDRAGGELYVDGRPRGALRATPRVFAVAPGERVFEVRAGVNVVARGTALVGPADGLEVRLEPVTAAPPAPTAPPVGGRPDPPPEPQRGAWKRTAGFVGLGLGAALIGAGVVTSLRVKGLDDDFTSDPALVNYRSGLTGSGDACNAAGAGTPSLEPGAATAGRFDRLCSASSALGVAQYVFYGAGALVAGAGAYLLATAPPKRDHGVGAGWAVRPWAGPDAGGVHFWASFLDGR
jgi:hypothetical protein